jgi:MraZ protein
VAEEGQLPKSSPPLGMYPGRLDDKGRIKLPTAFQQYLSSLPEKRLFVTSLDRRIAQIYPIQVWMQNQKFFQERKNPRLARKIEFITAELGAEAEMDAQGRITFPPELRRELALEDQTLRLYATNSGRIDVMSERMYEERRRESLTVTDEEKDEAESYGLN